MYKKKVEGFGKRNLYSVLLLIFFTAAIFYFKNKFFKPGFKHYTEFGIDMPTNYSIHGIDVSHYQDEIDWELVKKMKVKNIGIDFAFIKATEGTNIVDSQLEENMDGCKENNIPRGAYHYFIAAKSGKVQAANFIENAKLTKGDLPPVLDVEQSVGATKEQLQQHMQEWLDMVEAKFKTKPIIYCNIEYYNKYVIGKFDEYPIWIAHYLATDKPRISNSWAFWQHNEHGHVTGIREDVDFNVFSGNRWQFNNLVMD